VNRDRPNQNVLVGLFCERYLDIVKRYNYFFFFFFFTVHSEVLLLYCFYFL
jgi:hypothetical protein